MLFAALLVAAVSVLAYTNGRAALEAATGAGLAATAIEKQGALNTWIDQTETHVVVLSASTRVQESVADLLAANAAGDQSGAQTARARLVAELQPWVHEGRNFLGWTVLDPSTGQVITATDVSDEGKFRESQPFYIQGKTGPYVQNLYYAPSVQGPRLTISAPIRTQEGKLVGVLAGDLDLGTMNAIISRRTGLQQTDDAFLVNTSELFVTQPRFIVEPAVLQRGIHTQAVRLCLAGGSGVTAGTDYRGAPAFIAYRWLPERQLGLIVKIDQAEALAPVGTLRDRILFAGILALLLASVLAYWLARTITVPVKRLAKNAEAIGRGELHTAIEVRSHDEIGRLAAALGQMAHDLQTTLVSRDELLAEVKERRQAEEGRRESEDQLRQVFDHMSSGVAIYEAVNDGADFIIREFNPAAQRSMKRQREEVLGRRVTQVFPDVAEFGLLEVFKRVWTTGIPERHPTTLYQDNRLTVWVENYVYKVPSNEIVAIFDDVSERKLSEEALNRTRQLLEETQAISKLGGWEHDVAAGRMTWTDEVYRIYGVEPDYDPNILDRDIGFYSPESAPLIAEAFRRATEAGEAYDLELEFDRADGSRIWVRTRGRPVTESGVVVRITGNIMDITDRKRAEQDRLELERELQQSHKLESLGVLAGGIAHDFNNILTAVLGNAELTLADLSPSAPARKSLLEIIQASRRAAELCRQMLAYSGRGHFVIEPVELSVLVEDMLHLLQSTISKKALLNLHLTKNLPPLEGDASQLSQVIMNLVINASEAIGERNGVITISTGVMKCSQEYLRETHSDQNLIPGLYLTLEVSDTGCGMDANTQSRLFEPFFTTKFTGRGLGLSAVLGIVRGHKGALKLYSELGKGTTFKILLPAAGAELEAHTQNHGGGTGDWLGQGTVLLVDDEETIRDMGKRLLARLGFEVLTAADGREALEAYARHSDEIVLVLLDLTMPRMDGEETFRELRRLDPEVRVVLSSGYTEQDVTSRFAGKGLVGFLQKPYTMDQLQARLRAALAD